MPTFGDRLNLQIPLLEEQYTLSTGLCARCHQRVRTNKNSFGWSSTFDLPLNIPNEVQDGICVTCYISKHAPAIHTNQAFLHSHGVSRRNLSNNTGTYQPESYIKARNCTGGTRRSICSSRHLETANTFAQTINTSRRSVNSHDITDASSRPIILQKYSRRSLCETTEFNYKPRQNRLEISRTNPSHQQIRPGYLNDKNTPRVNTESHVRFPESSRKGRKEKPVKHGSLAHAIKKYLGLSKSSRTLMKLELSVDKSDNVSVLSNEGL